MNRSCCLMALLMLACPDIRAQERAFQFAEPGPRMIYVNLGADLLSSTRPVKEGIAYKIQRRLRSTQTWEEIGIMTAPANIEEFRKRLLEASKMASSSLEHFKIPIESLWEKISRFGRMDSLGFWGGVLPVRIASGGMFVDLTISSGASYEYSVSTIDMGGKNLVTVRSTPVSSPGTPKFGPLHLVESNSSTSQIEVRWVIDVKPWPAAYALYREEGLQGEFGPTPVSPIILSGKDASFIVVRDTLIVPNNVYRYYLVPMDYYGNTSRPSDTAMVASYNLASVPLPEYLTAQSSDSLGGIELKWRLRDLNLVRSIRVFRGDNFTSDFDQIGEIPGSDSSFVDLRVVPMQKYVYYLTLVGPLGDESPKSARVFGIFETSQPPIPPFGLRGELVRRGIQLRWIRNDDHVAGYYLYRNDGISDSLSQIFSLIPARDSVMTYLDTSATGAKRQFAYAVKAENTSHVLSAFSDTITVATIGGSVPIPTHLSGYADMSLAALTWDDLYSTDESIGGYLVHRRQLQKNGKAWSQYQYLPDTLSPEQNNYTDTTVIPGMTYEYAVQSLAFIGESSELSAPLRLHIPVPEAPAPAGLTAIPSGKDILLQWAQIEQASIVRYHVYRYQRGKKPQQLGNVNADNELQFIDRSVRKGSLYFYYVTSENSNGIESSPSIEVHIRP